MINPLLYWVFFWVSTAQADVVVDMDTFIVQPQVAQVLAEDLTANIHILREALQDGLQDGVIWREAPNLPLVKDDLFDNSLQHIPLPLLKPLQGLDVWLTVRFNQLQLIRGTDNCCVQTKLEVELLGIQMHDGTVTHIPIQVELLWVLSRDISTHWQALFEVLRVELSRAIHDILNKC